MIRAAAPVIYQAAMGLPQNDVVTLPTDPIQQQPTYDAALAAFKKLPQVRVLFDNGAGKSPTGHAELQATRTPGYEHSLLDVARPGHDRAHVVPRAVRRARRRQPPAQPGVNSFTADADALPLTDFGSNTGTGGLWGNASQWSWNWQQNPAGTAVSYVSEPLAANTTVVGSGAVHLWVRSSTPDVDLLATISEVRPDGNETFVQSGWIRAANASCRPTRTTSSSGRARRWSRSRRSRRPTPRRCPPASS